MNIKRSFAAVMLLGVTPALIYALGQAPKANLLFYVPGVAYAVCTWVGVLTHKRAPFTLAACIALVAVAFAAGYTANRTLNLLNMATFGCVGFAFIQSIANFAISFIPSDKKKTADIMITDGLTAIFGPGAMIAAMIGFSLL